GPHPFALRSTRPSAQAAAAFLRLRAPLRGLRSEAKAAIRLLRPAGARRRRVRRGHRSQDRSRAAQAPAAAMDLAYRSLPAPAQAADRGSAAPFRALPARVRGIVDRLSWIRSPSVRMVRPVIARSFGQPKLRHLCIGRRHDGAVDSSISHGTLLFAGMRCCRPMRSTEPYGSARKARAWTVRMTRAP